MARKIIDTYPVFTVSVGAPKGGSWSMTREQAEEAQAEFAELIDALKAATFRQFDVESVLVEDARCEHCNSTWTEASPDFNGGCCGKDEANSPERLAELRKLAEGVSDGTFYRYEEGKRGRVVVNWPDTLGTAVCVWMDAGRPATEIKRLIDLTRYVKSSDWCTLWQDPGPSGCSLARLPDSVSKTSDPENLADDAMIPRSAAIQTGARMRRAAAAIATCTLDD